MTDWTKNARGLFVYGGTLVTKEQLIDMDFLIAQQGVEVDKNVQAAYDAHIPCLFFYENRPEIWLNSGFDTTKWPDSANICLKEIKERVGSRAIQGVIIDCSRIVDSDGKAIMSSWIEKTGRWLIDRAKAVLNIPIYLYMNMEPINAEGANKELLFRFIEDNGISTASIVMCDPETKLPIPEVKAKLPFDNGNTKLNFWFYASKTNKIMYALSMKSVADLYTELKYVHASTDPTLPPEDLPNTDSNNLKRIIALENMVDLLKRQMVYHKLL